MAGVFLREWRGDLDTETETCPGNTCLVTAEATLQGCVYKPRNVKNCWQTPEPGRSKEGFSPRAFRRSTPRLTPRFQISSLQNRERINLCCFMPLTLRYSYVSAAPRNQVALLSPSCSAFWSRAGAKDKFLSALRT